MLELLARAALVLAAIPAALTVINLGFYRAPRIKPGTARTAVSILIPARDEARSIGPCVEAALASESVDLEVVVMDDHSRDGTPDVVRMLAAHDPRVRLEQAPPLPAGWNGKQHACAALADVATHPLLAFVDADVRLKPNGLLRMIDHLERRDVSLTSGIPAQRTVSLAEKLVVPLIHFVLLGFLPMMGMRWSRWPAFAAGCGQLFVARRDAYRAMGGHATIRASRHDGLMLPRAFRDAGFGTDLADATAIAECRMYRDAREVVNGFTKNATEGMAAPAAIGVWTLLLLGGQTLPLVLLGLASATGAPTAIRDAAIATLLAFGTRLLLTARFRQSWLGAALHPLGVAAVIAIQWRAWWQARRGQTVAWKGRAHAP